MQPCTSLEDAADGLEELHICNGPHDAAQLCGLYVLELRHGVVHVRCSPRIRKGGGNRKVFRVHQRIGYSQSGAGMSCRVGTIYTTSTPLHEDSRMYMQVPRLWIVNINMSSGFKIMAQYDIDSTISYSNIRK